MTLTANRLRLPFLGLALTAALIGFLSASGSPVVQADVTQAPDCEWNNGARMSQSLYYMASAYDSDNDVMYLFGGLNKDLDVQNFMQAIDFAGAAGPGDGKTSTRRNGTARLFGSTAFYRPSSEADTKGTIYVMFGSKDPGASDPSEGSGEDSVYAYDIEGNSWRVVPTGGVTLGDRLFAAAEYDPVNDIAVVTGGVKKCSLSDVPCKADSFETLYLRFDEDGNITAERGAAGGPRTLYGHTMNYDATAGRMLVHGGTTNGGTALSATWALEMGDLSGPAWSRVGSGGPSLVGHNAAYWPGMEWLVAHGGASNAPVSASENVNRNTYGLAFDAAGDTWGDLGASTSPTERMAASSEYVDNGVWQGVVVVGGRTRFDTRGSSVAANYNVLTCGDAVDVPTATPETPVPPTVTTEPGTPGPTVPAPTTAPPMPTTVGAIACPGLELYVPDLAITAGLAGAATISGWGERCYPNSPPSPWNGIKHYLSIRNPGSTYHPIYNGLVYKCGCP